MAGTSVGVERVDKLKTGDLHDLCDAADDAIRSGGGFGWLEPPAREVMERYWKGVLVVPERILFVGDALNEFIVDQFVFRTFSENVVDRHPSILLPAPG